MKSLHLFPLICATLLFASAPAPAQTADDTDETPPPGSTVITSDELHSDQQNHVSIFTGNVVTVGANFRMTCQEMTVNFTNDNKVDTIVATGDVIITQPNRVTHCGRADYFHDEDKFVLTDSPVILNGKDTLAAPKIIIYRTTQKIVTPAGQGRTNVILGPGAMSSPSTNSAPTTPSQ